jgi:hypothetical protein
MQEINLEGVFLPALLVWAAAAFLVSSLTARILTRAGFYRWVWHRTLFNFSVFVLVWGGISAAVYHQAFSGAWLR